MFVVIFILLVHHDGAHVLLHPFACLLEDPAVYKPLLGPDSWQMCPDQLSYLSQGGVHPAVRERVPEIEDEFSLVWGLALLAVVIDSVDEVVDADEERADQSSIYRIAQALYCIFRLRYFSSNALCAI